MKKFKNVVKLKYDAFNKFDGFVFCNLDIRLGGDWSDHYEEGDVISYDFNLLEKCDDEIDTFIDSWNLDVDDKDKVLLEDLKEYIGEGICYIDEYDERIWYNVNFEGDVMMIRYVYIDLDI